MRLFTTCNTSSSFSAILISFSLLIPSILAANGPASKAATLFGIPKGSAPGSCDHEDMDTIVSEAYNMAVSAVNAITAYQKQSAFSKASPGVKTTREAAYNMFGVKSPLIAGRVILGSGQSSILDKVKQNYQLVIDMLSSSSTLFSGKAVVVCDETPFNWVVTMGDLLPELRETNHAQAEQTLVSVYKEKDPSFPDYDGFYRGTIAAQTVMIADEGIKKPDGTPGGGLCSQTTIKASTWYNQGIILCCPAMFNLVPNLSGVARNGVPKGANIEQFLSAPGAFLHEMMHFLGSATSVGKIIDEQVNGAKAYTFAPCAILGTNDQARALTNADSYHYFAMMSYLNVPFDADGISE